MVKKIKYPISKVLKHEIISYYITIFKISDQYGRKVKFSFLNQSKRRPKEYFCLNFRIGLTIHLKFDFRKYFLKLLERTFNRYRNVFAKIVESVS